MRRLVLRLHVSHLEEEKSRRLASINRDYGEFQPPASE